VSGDLASRPSAGWRARRQASALSGGHSGGLFGQGGRRLKKGVTAKKGKKRIVGPSAATISVIYALSGNGK
jgi:hypothetical protein